MLRCTPLLAAADHFFTGRDLELRNDDGEWAAVAKAIGVERNNLLTVRQVHGAGVAAASRDRSALWPRPEADAIVSNDPASAAVVSVADCVPILLSDETGRVVAAIHAGWRGTVQRAAIEAVAALQARYGVRPERLIAAIGPCIGPCCYEVGESVVQAFRDAGHHATMIEQWFVAGNGGRRQLDLWKATRDQLEGSGVPPTSIYTAELCTKTHATTLHSYRVDGERAGRMAAVIRPNGRA